MVRSVWRKNLSFPTAQVPAVQTMIKDQAKREGIPAIPCRLKTSPGRRILKVSRCQKIMKQRRPRSQIQIAKQNRRLGWITAELFLKTLPEQCQMFISMIEIPGSDRRQRMSYHQVNRARRQLYISFNRRHDWCIQVKHTLIRQRKARPQTNAKIAIVLGL